MNVQQFKQLPVMGILRGIDVDVIHPLTEAISASGLKTVEIAMNTPNAPALIQHMVKIADGALTIGAGTVLTVDILKSALDAGASFIVLPTLVPEVVAYCVKKNIPVFPGAFTPQEIHTAWSAGATMVKVFPAKIVGPAYFKEIKGPFDTVELLACGGVNAENINNFFSCGASAVAFGSSIFKKEWLAQREFMRIQESIRTLLNGRID